MRDKISDATLLRECVEECALERKQNPRSVAVYSPINRVFERHGVKDSGLAIRLASIISRKRKHLEKQYHPRAPKPRVSKLWYTTHSTMS